MAQDAVNRIMAAEKAAADKISEAEFRARQIIADAEKVGRESIANAEKKRILFIRISFSMQKMKPQRQ